MPLVNFANLDFDQIKTSIKDYLRSNSNFTDYDFEGSNLSTIIDVLAYNTYITSYNANMVSNEVFIDSATLRENVVSLARNIGYTPYSKRSSQANISFFINTTDYADKPQTITLNKGLVASSNTFANESYTFAILDDITVPVSDNEASFDNVAIYEGIYLTETFTVNSFDPDQRFILKNSGIDLSTLRVVVKPSESSTVTRKYIQSDSLFNITSESPVYFVHEVEGERYELIFGDGIFGKKLDAPSFIEVSYLVTSGELANGINNFNFSGKLTSSRDNVTISSGVSLVTALNSSSLGQNIQSAESIKKYATQIYSSQKRAVTTADFEALIPSLYTETDSVSAFGGETLSPPQYGKVFVSIKPTNGPYLSDQIKNNIKREIKKYSVAGIDVDITDLKFLYIELNITAYFNSNLISSSEDVVSLIAANLRKYAKSAEMNQFGARFKYSKLLCMIDNSSDAITSNITTVVIRRDLRVALNSFAEYEICYGNCIFVKSCDGFNIKSSGFNVDGIAGVVYLTDKPDSGSTETGQIMLIQLEASNQAKIIKKSIGTIDYKKGEIKLSPINITNTVVNKGFPLVEISGSPCSNDVLGLHDLYAQIDLENTLINAISDSSDMDSAASSYANGSLVRGQKVIPGSTTCDTPDNIVFTTNGNGTTVASTTASSASTAAATSTSTTSSGGGGSASSGGGGSSYSY
jgi:uncharacterized membrane protein YgcG